MARTFYETLPHPTHHTRAIDRKQLRPNATEDLWRVDTFVDVGQDHEVPFEDEVCGVAGLVRREVVDWFGGELGDRESGEEEGRARVVS
jgi:hypothetical protein